MAGLGRRARLESALGLRTPVVGFALMAVSLLAARLSAAIAPMVLATVCAGAAGTMVIAFLTDFVNDVCPEGSGTLATSVMVSGGFAGASLTPAILSAIAFATGDASATGPFMPLACVCAVLAVVLLIVLREEKWQSTQITDNCVKCRV
ncbi:MAG: hypothetical protein Q4A01_11825 [Coriobacteriales bacterium]|nr:hypothetical protein [Coriobacteriales bacterium]